MINKIDAKKLEAAFDLIESYGIYCAVPGWFDLSSADEAVEFANDPDVFYEKRNIDYTR